MKILLLGMNHRSAPLELREQLAVDDPAPLLQNLVAGEEVEEAALLSTCNRVEVVALAPGLDAMRRRLHDFFRRDLAGPANPALPADLDRHLYEFAGTDAVRHLLRVASSLDSMVIGEPQILGQTKEAYRIATECGACGPILNRLFQNAFATAKRVRTETRLAERPVSVARVAVDLAGQIFDDFGDKRAVLIGAGEMVEAALQALRSRGLEFVSVANRTPERAAELAARFGATAHGLDELPSLVSRADVVLTSIGGDRPILTRELMAAALETRRKRPIFVIDLGVPRNAEPEIDQLENLYLYDIDDLGTVAGDHAEERRREAVRAEAIVVEQEQRFQGWFAGLRAVPTIRDLRERVEQIRSQEVERALGRLGLGSAEAAGVEALTRSLVNKILHAPLSRLREEAESGEGLAHLEAARVLFDLGDSGAGQVAGSETPSEEADGPGGAT